MPSKKGRQTAKNPAAPATPVPSRTKTIGRMQHRLAAKAVATDAPTRALSFIFASGLSCGYPFADLLALTTTLFSLEPFMCSSLSINGQHSSCLTSPLWRNSRLQSRKSTAEFGLQMSEAPYFVSYILELPFQYRLHFWANVLFLAKRQQFPDFSEREAQLLGMPHKREITNLNHSLNRRYPPVLLGVAAISPSFW